MDSLAIVGFYCLGTFVGLVVGWAVNQESELELKSISSMILAVGGSGASFIPLFSPNAGREIWFYPIALLVGLLIAPLLDVAFNWFYGLRWVKKINGKAKPV
jgi:hypothetical protein